MSNNAENPIINENKKSKKKLAIILSIIISLVLIAATVTVILIVNHNKQSVEDDAPKGIELLAGKTPKELYLSSIDYVKALENYEVLIDSKYITSYEDEMSEESSSTLHRCSGDTFYYLYKAEYYEEFFIHDGSMLYKNINNISEKEEISYDDFMKGWGSITEEGMLIDLCDEIDTYVIVKGIRNGDDLEYEMIHAKWNKEHNSKIETLFLPCDKSTATLSSTLVRSLIDEKKFDELKGLVSPCAIELLVKYNNEV